MNLPPDPYAARLDIDYPDKVDHGLERLTTFFRVIWIIPIGIILSLIIETGIRGGLFVATTLMLLFRATYPRWWFNFGRELTRFEKRVGAYLLLLTDRYPSTVDEQSVHLEIDYPNVEQDLNRWLPLVKWLLAIPHYIVLAVLIPIAAVVSIIAWFAILFTGSYPRGLFNYVVGVFRWGLRVTSYAFLLVTDQYPPFSLK